MPIGKKPDVLTPIIADYRARAAAAGKPVPEIITFSPLNTEDLAEAEATINAFAEAGVDRIVWISRYENAADCRQQLEKVQPLLASQ